MAHHRATAYTRSKFRSTEDELKRREELHFRRRAKQREQLEERSATNLDLLEALDTKERMLEIQSVMLGKLAAEENHSKGLTEAPGLARLNSDERVREVEEALTMLKY